MNVHSNIERIDTYRLSRLQAGYLQEQVEAGRSGQERTGASRNGLEQARASKSGQERARAGRSGQGEQEHLYLSGLNLAN